MENRQKISEERKAKNKEEIDKQMEQFNQIIHDKLNEVIQKSKAEDNP